MIVAPEVGTGPFPIYFGAGKAIQFLIQETIEPMLASGVDMLPGTLMDQVDDKFDPILWFLMKPEDYTSADFSDAIEQLLENQQSEFENPDV